MDSQLHRDYSESGDNPPSFTPSHNNDSSHANIPPSFTPKRGRKAKKSPDATISKSKSSAQSFAPSFTPESAPSFAPSFTPAGSRKRVAQASTRRANRTTAYAQSKNEIRPQRISQSLYQRAKFDSAQNVNENISAAAKTLEHKPHIFLKVFIALIAIIAISCVGLGAYSWNWVDSHINRTTWLTNTPSTQGTSWLILGSDQREGEEAKEITGFRTDTILVLTKPSNGNSSLISIPRDSLVSVNGEKVKINSVAQFAGNKALTSIVEKITGHRIDHVAEVRFGGLTNVVDAIDGIDLCYNRTVNDRFSGLNWTAGCHHADGKTALAFSRMRYADPESDFGRAARQRMVIAAIMKKALDKKTITNFGKVKKLAETGLSSVIFDEKSNPGSLWQMAQAFKEATGSKGITGTVYWTNPDYQVPGVGSCVLLDDAKNLELFNQLAEGTHKPGAVGTFAELQQ